MRDGPTGDLLTVRKSGILPEGAGQVKGEGRESLVRSAGLVSTLTLLSRVLGLAREQAFAALVGAGAHADAFHAAFRIPNLLRDLFAEGALSAALVPTYARSRARGEEHGSALVRRLVGALGVVMALLVALGLLCTRPLVDLLAPGFAQAGPGKTGLTVALTRIMLPFLPLVSFAAVAMGVLNARGRFAVPAFAPSTFNLVAILWAMGLWAAGFGPETVVYGWAAGTLLGGAAQLLVQVPELRRAGLSFRPEWAPRDPGLREIAKLMAPATLGLAAVQVNIFVSTRFASQWEGAVAALQYAFRLLYLPIGVFGVAVGTVAASALARRAAAGDLTGLRATLRQSLSTLAVLTLPASVGLIVLARPIVSLLFERGRFSASDTERTAAAVALYALGLVAYTGVKVLAPAFYALGSPRVPLLASASAVAGNLVTILALQGRLGFRAVALGTALGSVLNALVLLVSLQRRVGSVVDRTLLVDVAGAAAASAVMAPVAWAAARGLGALTIAAPTLVGQLVTGLGPVLVGLLAFATAAYLMKVPACVALAALITRRRPRT
jgi:putative peptidoglycan lipid II flippase